MTRPGPFSNPIRVGVVCQYGDVADRSDAVMYYACWLHEPEQAALRERMRRELRGLDLACYCPLPKPGEPDHCHAVEVLRVANEPSPAVHLNTRGCEPMDPATGQAIAEAAQKLADAHRKCGVT